ncbi:hypothetical protein AB1Y20_004257 [Prymnesium parvum]|uniref:enoyl-[acyl-carrier-protein] reductase n=1 Tax=Prymnesium parvum TaxID=97485 RepID=A0AB34J974_PRYPA|mmetsp:Transcript_34954/g.86988  ORF Transcript_34954/g.86988 Transcript_34954/m.86988 type:complete len:655 (+) Transcript_34954:38-2002(+)
MSSNDWYAVLGVPKTATSEQIRNAFKERAMVNHPDRGGDKEVYATIQTAYDILSDVSKRAAYDSGKSVNGGTEKQFAQSFGDSGTKPKMSISQQVDDARKDGQIAQMGNQMSHGAGFDAWMRNQKGLGKHGFYTAEDLLRQKKGGIEATDATATPLPPLNTTAICFDKHGPPEEVLYLDKARPLADKLGHGEVLVHMLAASISEEDLLRVQTSLSILNDFAPFNRTHNKWEELPLPAVAGVEGVGVVLATAKNVPELSSGALEVKDWVIALPDARMAPIGCWGTLCICDSARLLKVPAQLLPLQHLACSRALCTAYRILEDYGSVKPGDTVLQNCADLPTGQAVIQLCKMLKIRTINLVPDDAGFERTRDLLMELGGTLVLRDTANVSTFLKAIGNEMPRLAIDALGGEAGKRLAIALRPGGTLVVHSLAHGQVPQLSPSLIMYQQISMHGFNLPQWVADNGGEAYLAMLESIAELVQAEKLNVFTRTLSVDQLTQQSLLKAIGSHKLVQDGATFRERTVLQFGDEASANEMYFELQAAIRKITAAYDDSVPSAKEMAPVAPTASSAMRATGGVVASKPRASERWADSTEMLKELNLEQYTTQFEEEEMTSLELLEEIVSRGDGEKELMDALKEMGIKKMGHRQAIVGAVVGKL